MIFKPVLNVYVLLALVTVTLLGVSIITFRQPRSRRKQWLARVAMVALLGFMMFRPSISGGTSQGGLTNLDVMYVVDTTSSMAAEDWNGKSTRLTGVKKDIEGLTTALAGARFSIISFDSKASLVLPFTTDATAVTTQANTLNQEITYYAVGSKIDTPIDLVKTQLELDKKAKPERSRIVVYFGDGEQTAGGTPKSFDSVRKFADAGLVFGYGTAQGARMKEFYAYDTKESEIEYIKDYSTDAYPTPEALSKIDEGNLKNIAKQLGGRYELRARYTDPAPIVRGLGLEKLQKTTTDIASTTDVYWLLTVPLLGLFMFDINRVFIMLSDMRKGKQND